MRVAIDAGGTFTDLAVIDETGALSSHKVLSHPEDPARGMLDALDSGVDVERATTIVNGTTAGLNAVLSRSGARVLVVTTDGFADVLAIGRAHRSDVWQLRYRKPQHLMDAADVCGVRERVDVDGSVRVPLNLDDLEAVSDLIDREGIRTVAVCFLHSMVNPAHEVAARDFLEARHPGLHLSLSHEVAPEVGEFERFSSTVVNAYVATTVGQYLSRVSAGLVERGHDHPLLVMRSSGGVTSARSAQARPMQTLLSGPAGGVIGAQTIARTLGLSHLLAIDMGGTSLDVSVIVDQRLAVRTELEIDGIPMLMPVVDLVTVSAGGGSIGWVQNGALHVGPHSAGANPGPACYGLGGVEPTVTDANVVLGRLGHSGLADGALTLDRAAARQAFAPVADELGMTIEETAQAVLDITDARMSDALRTVTVRRGHDPRDFCLLAFGGAGPLHAAALADELGIASVVVPPAPGVFSAWGMLHAPVRHDLSESLLAPLDEVDAGALAAVHERLRAEARALLADDGFDPDAATYLAAADLRFAGQQFSITIELPIGSPIGDWDAAFRAAYATSHGTVAGNPPTEFANVRLTAVGPEALPPSDGAPAAAAGAHTAEVVCAGQPMEAVVCTRSSIGAGVTGPAILSDPGSTVFVPPGWHATAGPAGSLLLSKVDA